MTTVVNLRLAPPLPMIPERLHGVPVATIVCCYAGAGYALSINARGRGRGRLP